MNIIWEDGIFQQARFDVFDDTGAGNHPKITVNLLDLSMEAFFQESPGVGMGTLPIILLKAMNPSVWARGP